MGFKVNQSTRSHQSEGINPENYSAEGRFLATIGAIVGVVATLACLYGLLHFQGAWAEGTNVAHNWINGGLLMGGALSTITTICLLKIAKDGKPLFPVE